MIKITEENWNKINQMYQDRLDEIALYKIENDKLTKKLNISEANLSTVLNKLNEAFNTIERHNLKNRDREVKTLDILI